MKIVNRAFIQQPVQQDSQADRPQFLGLEVAVAAVVVSLISAALTGFGSWAFRTAISAFEERQKRSEVTLQEHQKAISQCDQHSRDELAFFKQAYYADTVKLREQIKELEIRVMANYVSRENFTHSQLVTSAALDKLSDRISGLTAEVSSRE